MPENLKDKKIEVKTDVFEGPLDLLLNLIEKRKLFINDISLAKVTEDYIDFVNEQRVFPLSQASHFIYISSTLLLIKSKSLLPNMELTEEEEESIEELETRLKLNKIFKKLGDSVRGRFGKKILFKKKPSKKEPVFNPPKELNIDDICEGIENVLSNLPKKNKLQEASVKKKINLSDVMENMSKKINSSLQISFKEFSNSEGGSRENVLANFLAILELVRKGRAIANQYSNFSDITIEPIDLKLPQYE